MNRIVIYIIAILLTGCAAGTVKEIKADPANELHLSIDQNYQRVYKSLLDKMRECMGEGWVGVFAQMHIQNAIFSELKEANISYVMSNLGTQNYYLHIDIFGVPEEKTKLDAFVSFSTWQHVLPKVELWATRRDAPCDLPSH